MLRTVTLNNSVKECDNFKVITVVFLRVIDKIVHSEFVFKNESVTQAIEHKLYIVKSYHIQILSTACLWTIIIILFLQLKSMDSRSLHI